MQRNRMIAFAGAVAAAAVLSIAGATSASAATNGQQVAVSTYWSDEVYICGDNQSNNYVCSPWFNTPGTGYTELVGWWWKGTVVITGYDETNGTGTHRATCQVPTSQSGNITFCDGRDNRTL